MKTVAQTVIEADRFYTIAAHTGNVIQAVEGEADGSVRLGKYEHKPEQEWSFVRVGEGVYRICNRANGKMLDLMMTGTANGTWLHLWEDVSGTSQMWTVEPTPEGTVRLRSSWAGGKCVDTVGMGAELGAVLQIWQEVNGGDQLWTITEVKERAKRAAKKAEAAPVVEEKVEETAPAAVEEKVEETAPAAVEEKVEETAPAAVEEKVEETAPAAVEEKTEETAPAVVEEKAAPAPAAKKPAAKTKTSRAKRKAAAKKK